ncbi:MAG TPA: DUF4290 domain-containing protein [Rikenellaceae bacterium]|nr:DUF4290 domain-containing protein [Rikenellaceae bacterium]
MDNNIKRVYGHNVVEMVQDLKTIEDKDKRTRQAYAIVKVMEILNPTVRSYDEYEHKLWDHLFMLADFDLDVDAPYPMPSKAEFETKPLNIPMKDTKIRASHYGRNIEKILDLLAKEPDGEEKTALIRSLAIYMRTQYLIWNKDSVSDETIFSDIEKLSEGRVKVPEGVTLGKLDSGMNLSRPSIGNQSGVARNNNGGKQFGKKSKGNFRNNKHR